MLAPEWGDIKIDNSIKFVEEDPASPNPTK
jgi:hypothetical protein